MSSEMVDRGMKLPLSDALGLLAFCLLFHSSVDEEGPPLAMKSPPPLSSEVEGWF